VAARMQAIACCVLFIALLFARIGTAATVPVRRV
jgi:hypothetical protein